MLSFSTDLTAGGWQADPLLSIRAGAADPLGGNGAFILVNSGQIDQALSQQISAPAYFEYCFSVFVSAARPTSLTLGRAATSFQFKQFAVNSSWTRLVSSGRLDDNQLTFTVSIVIPAGQSVIAFGPQLEPQLSPSRYRPTSVTGGIYPNAHFLDDSITFESEAPGHFSTVISIETT